MFVAFNHGKLAAGSLVLAKNTRRDRIHPNRVLSNMICNPNDITMIVFPIIQARLAGNFAQGIQVFQGVKDRVLPCGRKDTTLIL